MKKNRTIVVIAGEYPVYDNKGNKTGKTKLSVSHGVDMETLSGIPLPCKEPHEIGATYDEVLGEWIIQI